MAQTKEDITQPEARGDRAEQQLRELLEAAPDAIMQVDETGRIVLLNRVAEVMFGYPRAELLGQPIEVLIPLELRSAHVHHRGNYNAHPATRAMGLGLELWALRRDGSRFPVEISLSPAQSEEGVRVTAIIRDITERKRAEEKLRSLQEAYVRDLTATNRELELRNREIERANRLKSEFLASMSHELRTPLHTVIGFSELLAEELEGPLNEKQKRFVNHIHRDSLHLLELINDILDLSKVEAGKLDLHLQAFNALDAVQEVLNTIAPLASSKRIAVELKPCPVLDVQADRIRLKQILLNLLSNAVKF